MTERDKIAAELPIQVLSALRFAKKLGLEQQAVSLLMAGDIKEATQDLFR